MHVLLDDRPCQSHAATIAEAIFEGVRLARSRGRMVVDVYVDGVLMSHDELASDTRLSRPATEVRLNTVLASDLAQDALRAASDALVEADDLHRRAAELIQAGQMGEAMGLMSQALAIWSSVQSAASQGSEAAGIDLEAVEVDGIAMRKLIETLNGKLRQLRDALSAGDTVTLADTLLYDLPPVVTEWRGLLHELARLADDARLRHEG